MQTKSTKVSTILILIVAFIFNVSILYGYFIFVYQNASNIVRKMTVDSMLSQTTFIINNLNSEVLEICERHFEALQNHSFDILAMPELKSYDYYDIVCAQNDVENTTRILLGNSVIISDVSAYFIDHNIKISAIKSIDEITEADRQNIDRLLQNNANRLIYQNGKICTFTSLRHNLSSALGYKEIPSVFIISEISMDKINTQIGNYFSISDKHHYALVRNDAKEILASSLNREEAEQFSSLLKNWDYDNGRDYSITDIDHTNYVVTHSSSNELGWTLFMIIPEQEVFIKLNILKNLILFSVVVFLLTLLFFFVIVYVLIYHPIKSLIFGFSYVMKGRFSVSLPPTLSKEFDSLFFSFNLMTQTLNDLIEREYKQKILIRDAELKQLQFQINPHFLFNTFFTLNSMMKNGDYDKAEYMSNLLGSYFEYIFHNKDDTVRLKDEIEYAKVYCDIQRIRYPNTIIQGIDDMPEEIGSIIIPKLILQPIFENAFKYALVHKQNSSNIVKVSFKITDDDIQIDIEDNGKNLENQRLAAMKELLVQQTYEGESALININRRIKLYYGDEYGLDINRSEFGGIKVSVKLHRR